MSYHSKWWVHPDDERRELDRWEEEERFRRERLLNHAPYGTDIDAYLTRLSAKSKKWWEINWTKKVMYDQLYNNAKLLEPVANPIGKELPRCRRLPPQKND